MDQTIQKNEIETKLFNPFPGLRPFSTDEAHLFFGREGQSEEVLNNLAKNKFAAVLGASGSGKSSLIYCGLLPTLYGGFLHNERSKWKIVITRPGSDPINNLANSIASTFSEEDQQESDSFINHSLLKRSALGIKNVIEQCKLAKDENVLILVDQFEELFRFQFSSKDQSAQNQAEHFVNLLVNAIKQEELPIYIVLTMRSDFIGECSPFQQLTKMINDSHYLIPRMTREDFKQAIEGPVAVGGGKISDQLVQLLLNEMGNNPDQLPILQHALMRTWDYWMNNNDTKLAIEVAEYDAVGRLERALSNHANEAYDELKVDEKLVCEVLLKSLTEKGADNRGIRRPTTVDELVNITESNEETVIKIADIFRKKGRTFLTPGSDKKLDKDSIVDISHESLMRVWDKLKIWVEEESSAVGMYTKLAESAASYQDGKISLWRPPDLQLAINWRDKHNPNLAWAQRYNPAFERTMVYLKTSEEEYIAEEENKLRLQRRAIRRSRVVAVVLGTAAMISIGIGIYAQVQRQEAIAAQTEAEAQTKLAEEQSLLAIKNAEEAKAQQALAEEQTKIAETQTDLAEEKTNEALVNLDESKRQKAIAEEQSKAAEEQRKKAEQSALEAKTQEQLAVEARLEAEKRRVLSIGQSMAVKSQLIKQDTVLKGLLAYQSYIFNKENEGLAYDPDVFKAIYSSQQLFRGIDYNMHQFHTDIVWTFDSNSDKLYSGGSDGQLIEWNLENFGYTVLLTDLSIIKKVVLKGNKVYGIAGRELFIYNLDNKNVDRIPLNLSPKDLFISSNEEIYLLTSKQLGTFSIESNSFTSFFETEDKISVLEYIEEDNQLFIGLTSGTIMHWKDLNNTSAYSTFFKGTNLEWASLKYNKVKNQLVAGMASNQGLIYIWDVNTKKSVIELSGHNAKVTSLAFSSKGDLMASASYDGSVKLWHLNDLGSLPIDFDDHQTWVLSVKFTADDKHIISGDRNGIIRELPVFLEELVDGFCERIPRSFTTAEWVTYVGEDIPYRELNCNIK